MVIVQGQYEIQCFTQNEFEKAKELIKRQADVDSTIQYTIIETELKIVVEQRKTLNQIYV